MTSHNSTLASSFADLADVEAFARCKSGGHSDEFCFKFGDNGIGAWGDFTADERTPMCALPPEDWLARWGTKAAARGRRVIVIHEGKAVIGELRDTMPHKANIHNGCGIDLNPGFAKAFGLKPPFKVPVVWAWDDDEPEPPSLGWLSWIRRLFGRA